MSKVNIQLDAGAITRVQHELGELEKKTPLVLRSAVNSTARKAITQFTKQARSIYIVSSKDIKQAIEYKKATTRNLTAIIAVRGEIRDLMDYKVTPSELPEQNHKPRQTKAKVLRKSKMRPLIKGDIKAFVTKFKNGHVAVVQRLTRRNLPIVSLYSTSIPKMFSESGRVMENVLPEVHRMYGEEVSVQLEKMLERMRRSST